MAAAIRTLARRASVVPATWRAQSLQHHPGPLAQAQHQLWRINSVRCLRCTRQHRRAAGGGTHGDADTGAVKSLTGGVAWVDRLESVAAGEVVTFASGAKGLTMNLEADRVGIAILERLDSINVGDTVTRTKSELRVPVGDAVRGRVVDGLGNPLDGNGPVDMTQCVPVVNGPPQRAEWVRPRRALHSGLKVVDPMLFLRRGARYALAGVPFTGKTSFALDVVLNQANCAANGTDPLHCVYVVIGQHQAAVGDLVHKLEASGALAYSTVVCASAAAPPGMQCIAPFVGTAMAEHYRELGDDALVVYDDLSRHAEADRELGRLLHRPPGSFFTHGALIERSAQLTPERGGGSVSALALVEVPQAGDASEPATSLHSLVDETIHLDHEQFQRGFRPAVRLEWGTVDLTAGIRWDLVNPARIRPEPAFWPLLGLKLDLLQGRSLGPMANVVLDELDECTRQLVMRRDRIEELLKQPPLHPMMVSEQAIVLNLASYFDRDALHRIPVEQVVEFGERFLAHVKAAHPELLDDISESDQYRRHAIEDRLREAVRAFVPEFLGEQA